MADVIEIRDLSGPELSVYNCRSEVQLLRYYEPQPGIFIAESPKVIMRALDAGYEPVSLLAERRLLGKAEGCRDAAELWTSAENEPLRVKASRMAESADSEEGEQRRMENSLVAASVAGKDESERIVSSDNEDQAALLHVILRRCRNVPVYTAGLDTLTQITGFHLTQGVLCAMRRRVLPSAEEVCAGAKRIAVLEDVTNQTNIGAVFRSAAALGFDAVLLTRDCCDPLYRRSIRVSMGTVFQIPWTYIDDRKRGEYAACENSMEELQSRNQEPDAKRKSGNSPDRINTEISWQLDYVTHLQNMGFAAAAMALREDSVRIDDPRLLAEEKIAVILGNEGSGLRDSTIRACDYTIRIPMDHGVDSLNVAAAGAVAFWELGQK